MGNGTVIYAQIDVHFPDDPKVAGVHPLAELAYLRIVLHSRRMLSDGLMDKRVACRWLVGIEDYEDYLEQLVDAELLERCEQGWRIPKHVWQRWNPTSDEIEEVREAKSAGATLANHRRWHVARKTIDPSCAHCASQVRVASDQTPVSTDQTTDNGANPVEEETEEETEREISSQPELAPALAAPPVVEDDGFEGFWQQYPRRDGVKVGKAKAHIAWRRIPAAKRPDVHRALAAYVASGISPKDAQRWLVSGVWDEWLRDDVIATSTPAADERKTRIRDGIPEVWVAGSGWARDHRTPTPGDWED